VSKQSNYVFKVNNCLWYRSPLSVSLRDTNYRTGIFLYKTALTYFFLLDTLLNYRPHRSAIRWLSSSYTLLRHNSCCLKAYAYLPAERSTIGLCLYNFSTQFIDVWQLFVLSIYFRSDGDLLWWAVAAPMRIFYGRYTCDWCWNNESIGGRQRNRLMTGCEPTQSAVYSSGRGEAWCRYAVVPYHGQV